jgi:(2Fe-2S) ferredoxin
MQRHPPHQSCSRGSSVIIADRLEQEARNRGLNVAVERSDCMRMCRNGPYVRLFPEGRDWLRVSRNDIPGILDYLESRPHTPLKDLSASVQ